MEIILNFLQNSTELFVSHKLGKVLPCIIDSDKKPNEFYVVDVSSDRALIVGSNSEYSSTLYVSDELGGNDGIVKFTVSLPDVFCYFPNRTWHNSWLKYTISISIFYVEI